MSKNIKLRDAQGVEHTYNSIKAIEVPEAGTANKVTFVYPEGTKQIRNTGIIDVSENANAQIVESNLVATNIKKDVSILGVTGTYEGSGGGGGDTPLGDCTNIILSNYEAPMMSYYDSVIQTLQFTLPTGATRLSIVAPDFASSNGRLRHIKCYDFANYGSNDDLNLNDYSVHYESSYDDYWYSYKAHEQISKNGLTIQFPLTFNRDTIDSEYLLTVTARDTYQESQSEGRYIPTFPESKNGIPFDLKLVCSAEGKTQSITNVRLYANSWKLPKLEYASGGNNYEHVVFNNSSNFGLISKEALDLENSLDSPLGHFNVTNEHATKTMTIAQRSGLLISGILFSDNTESYSKPTFYHPVEPGVSNASFRYLEGDYSDYDDFTSNYIDISHDEITVSMLDGSAFDVYLNDDTSPAETNMYSYTIVSSGPSMEQKIFTYVKLQSDGSIRIGLQEAPLGQGPYQGELISYSTMSDWNNMMVSCMSPMEGPSWSYQCKAAESLSEPSRKTFNYSMGDMIYFNFPNMTTIYVDGMWMEESYSYSFSDPSRRIVSATYDDSSNQLTIITESYF